MAREYTTRSITAGGAAKAADLNVELTGSLRQLNGGIDQHALPLGAIPRTKLTAWENMDNPEPYSGTRSTYGPVNSYHRGAEDDLGVDIDPGEDAGSPGWRRVADLTAGATKGHVLEFVARDGMIRGGCGFNFMRRTSYVRRDDGVFTYPFIHRDDWLRIGVFLNDILVADTGQIFPRRCTVSLPFAYPAPQGYCRIDIRYRQFTRAQLEDGTVYAGATWTYPGTAERFPHIFFYRAALWARNQYG
jgi:hypothetical protein